MMRTLLLHRRAQVDGLVHAERVDAELASVPHFLPGREQHARIRRRLLLPPGAQQRLERRETLASIGVWVVQRRELRRGVEVVE